MTQRSTITLPAHLLAGTGAAVREHAAPRRRSLRRLLGDDDQEPHVPPMMSERIWITVKDDEPEVNEQ
jgi:hypothetical protein